MPSSNTWTLTGFPGASGTPGSRTAMGRERTWNNTPNFGALPKDEKPVNGYSDSQYRTYQNERLKMRASVLDPSVSYNDESGAIINNGALGAAVNGRIHDRFSDWDSIVANQLNATIVKALVKMADAKVNVAVAYAEASKTSDLILDTARRIDRAYRAFRKGNLRGVAQNLNITPKRLHKSWLEYKYGWMPLLMDVKGSAEYFAQQNIGRNPRFTVSAKESVVKTDSWGYNVPTYGGGAPHKANEFVSVSHSTRVKIWCELSSPHYSTMQQLGLTNPALIAWELIPFSFVFDWFIQVGDWLTAMSAHHGVVIRRAMVSTEQAGGWTLAEQGSSTSDLAWIYTSSPNQYGASARHYTRTIPDLHPFSLYPPKTNSFNFPKLVTSLALIQGTYRGSSRTSRI